MTIEKQYISWDEFHQDVKLLAEKIQKTRNFNRLIAISRGGLIPAGIISYELNLRNCDTICVQSYDDTVRRDKEDIRILNTLENINEKTLFIDDLTDSGETVKTLRRLFPSACFAVVYTKPEGKNAAQIYARELPDQWIVFPWDVE